MADAMAADEEADPEPVENLPPSCKLVYKMLEFEGALTSKQLAEKTMLAPRTIRYATERLEQSDHISSEVDLADARTVFVRSPDE